MKNTFELILRDGDTGEYFAMVFIPKRLYKYSKCPMLEFRNAFDELMEKSGLIK